MSILERAKSRIRVWRADPVQFVRENFKVEPDEWQKDALMAVGGAPRAQRRLAMKACTGPGKSAGLSWIGWHRLACFASQGEHPKGAALSITADNLKDNLWAELAKWQGRSEFLTAAFTWTKERIFANDHAETWFLSARSFKQDADAEAIGRALSGLHSKFPFVLLDETGDMPVAVLKAAEQIFTGNPSDALIAAAGNPTSTSGLLYHVAVLLRNEWTVITITADPDDPKRTPRVSVDLARKAIEKYGRENPWVMATILGQFPPGGFDSLLTINEVEAAMARRLRPEAYGWAQKRLGVDVARFGDDRTIIFPRQGLYTSRPVEMRNADSVQVAARVALALSRWNAEMVLVDGTGGWGAGVVDVLRQAGHGPIEVVASGNAQEDQFHNARAEMWWRMAEWVKAGGALPNIPELVRELTEPQYTYKSGKFLMEEKDHIKDRLGFSPDLADALAQTFYLPDMPARIVLPDGRELDFPVDGPAKRHASDYDPLA